MQNPPRQYSKNGSYASSGISPENFLSRQLPCSIEAEKSVLGAILLNDKHITQVAELLAPSDFYIPAHKTIFEVCLEIFQSNKRIDIVTLQDILDKNQKLQEIGGITYLIGLQEEIPALGLVEQHANIIKEKSILRDLIVQLQI